MKVREVRTLSFHCQKMFKNHSYPLFKEQRVKNKILKLNFSLEIEISCLMRKLFNSSKFWTNISKIVSRDQCSKKQRKLDKRFPTWELQKLLEFKDWFKSFKSRIELNLKRHKNCSFMNSVLNGIALWKTMNRQLSQVWTNLKINIRLIWKSSLMSSNRILNKRMLNEAKRSLICKNRSTHLSQSISLKKQIKSNKFLKWPKLLKIQTLIKQSMKQS